MINLERLREYPIVSVDNETTGLRWYRGDRTFGVAVAVWDGHTTESQYWDIREKPGILSALRAEVPHCKLIVNHNIKFDAHFLRGEKIELPEDRIDCTMVRSALIDEHRFSYSLDSLAKDCLGAEKVDIYNELAELFGGKATREAQMKNLHRAPSKLAGKYAKMDPELAIRLWLWQEEEIKKQGIQKICDFERRLLPVLIDIERRGVAVDEDRAVKSVKNADNLIAKAQSDLDRLAGKPVNANSPPQMRALFGAEKVEHNGRVYWQTSSGFRLESTDNGQASIGKDSLRAMAGLGDERAKKVLALRQMIKAKSFLKDHILGHAVNGRVYPNYNQTKSDNDLGTGSGRFSINDPALQQIPARDVDIASQVRPCFLPEEESVWACADWEQFEFRWFAHYTKDPGILKRFADDPDTDFHQVVSDITGISRNPRFAGDANAKQINLGLVFGMGQGEMAFQMGLEYTERVGEDGRVWKNAGPKAQEIFEKYHSAIPGVRAMLNQASSIARNKGFVRTIMGRHIRFPRGRFTHKAGGLVFQGTSADCIKQKMIELHPVSKKEGFDIILSVHDELDFSFPKKEAKWQSSLVKEALETFDGVKCPIQCRVPIRSSVATGLNWWEACKKS